MDNCHILNETIQILKDIKHSTNELEAGLGELCSNMGQEIMATDMEDWEEYTLLDTIQIIRDETRRIKHLFRRMLSLEEQTPPSSSPQASPLETLELGDSSLIEIENRLKELLNEDSDTDEDYLELTEKQEEEIDEIEGDKEIQDEFREIDSRHRLKTRLLRSSQSVL